MLANAESWREYAHALQYLARVIGTDTPAQLRTIARALSKIRWDLPAPDQVDEEGAIYGHPKCVCEYVLNELAPPDEENGVGARALLRPLPGNDVIKKMCYITTLGGIFTGYELAAVKGPERRVAIFGTAGLSENEAESLLRRGYSCLFVRTTV